MIDINTYRARIGMYGLKNRHNTKCKGNVSYKLENIEAPQLECLVFILIYLYYILYFATYTMLTVMSLTVNCTGSACFTYNFEYIRPLNYAFGHPYVAITNTKIFYMVLVAFATRRIYSALCFTLYHDLGDILYSNKADVERNNKIDSKSSSNFIEHLYQRVINRMTKVIHCCRHTTIALTYSILLINFLLIAIVNPALLNPGPANTLSVAYQNIQGLIPFSQLNEENPTLDVTKSMELNLFINEQKPDILVLNETWLKSSIKNNELLPPNYKIFRIDRSLKSHPPCPTNPTKYRRNGGGVLIAIRSDIDIVSQSVNLKCNAEILGVELLLSDGKKVLICSCYRVGTLGASNHSQIDNYLKSIKRKRKINSIYMIGDMNLAHANWDTLSSTDHVEQSFINTFCELGFDQLIQCPTHIKGNLLDVVLTTEPHKVENLAVASDLSLSLCKSDHYMITFNIKYKCRRKKPTKRSIYNFKQL